MLALLGIIAGVLSFSSNIPYILDTIKKKTKPHRVTWGIFFLLNIIFLGNHVAAGATSSLWLVVAFAISTGTVFVLSFKGGVGGTTPLDILVLSGAMIGVVIWQLLDAPLASIVANIAVAAIAAVPTYRKSWVTPESETSVSYSLGSLAAGLSAISVGRLELALLLLPLYSVIYQGSIFAILEYRKRKIIDK